MQPIKILVINPNSTVAATQGVLAGARTYAGDAFLVDAVGNEDGPDFIDTEADRVAAAPGMQKILLENEADYDGFVVACHCDPNVPLLRTLTTKPVVGIGQASMHMAAMSGKPFSIVTTGPGSVPEKIQQLERYGLATNCVSYSPGILIEGGSDTENAMEQRILRGARVAVEQDGAAVIVPAITGFPGIDTLVERTLGVTVMDGLACAMYMARDLAVYSQKKGK